MAKTTQKRNGPGKSFRKGMSLAEAIEFFADPEFTESWFIEQRWPDGVVCPKCESTSIQQRPSRTPQPFRCNTCRYDFSVKTDTVMHASKLPLKAWGLALYLNATSLKGVASMKLYRDLGVTQKTAWYLGHRIRKTWEYDTGRFAGPVEVDETYIGGKEANKHTDKKLNAGRGPVGKAVVVGARDRATGKVATKVVDTTDAPTLQGFVREHTELGAHVYTDENQSYRGVNRAHQTVKHSAGVYVDGQAHTNSIESHWALLKRGIIGTYHHLSEKHLQRYVTEFEGRHNNRRLDTIEQMSIMAANADGKRLSYADLIGEPETRQPRML